MGLSNGPRCIVNDMKEGGEQRAIGLNVVRNQGISGLKNL